MLQYGTKKTLFICGTLPAGGVLLEMQNYFEITLNIFEISC